MDLAAPASPRRGGRGGEGHRIEGPADAPQPGQTILFDLAHLATSDLQYNLSIWSSLKGTLAGRGYTLNHHATGALTGAALQGQDVLVIQDPQVSFSAAEKTAVVDFANAGGGLLIAGEWGPAWPNGVVIELLNLFGASYDNVEVWDQTHFIVVPEWVVYEAQRNFLPHAALGQVAKIVLPAGSTMSGTPDWSTVVETDEDALPARRPIAMARGFGGGRVFALGDTSVWYDHHIDKYDNRAFGVNVMEWLLFRL